MTHSKQSAQDILAARMAEIAKKNPRNAQRQPENEQQSKFQQSSNKAVVQSHLSPKRHPNADFFVIDVFDASLKDDLASMEHPIFALKNGDTRNRFYEHNGNTITIMPSSFGCATIYDKDVWIYCISALINAQNNNEPINRVVRFTAYDFLVSTNRNTSGRYYQLLREALFRLAGTRIITNVKTGNYRLESNFGLLDKVDIIYKDETDENSPIIAIEVTLPDWLFRSIEAKQVKTISADYFRLRKPLDRRIYELCAKHCGKQKEWHISLEILHRKSGSMATLRRFRQAIKELVASNDLPDYRLTYDDKKDVLRVRNRNWSKFLRKLS
jgi:hypothetical protein